MEAFDKNIYTDINIINFTSELSDREYVKYLQKLKKKLTVSCVLKLVTFKNTKK